jgi:Excalibur calcium-binding domain
VNRKFPHGVGRAHAHDHVKGKTKPVTNFVHSNALYTTAMKWNADLDRDKDGVACEKR